MTVDVAVKQDGLYVYCVARGKDHYPLGPIGLDGQRVYTLASGDLCAVVHDRQAEPYQSEDAQAVEGWALTHQQVVSTATEAFGTVLPMAFNMIVHGDENGGATENLAAWLEEKRDRFTGLLDKLAGKAEYGVQIFWEPKVVTAALIRSMPELRRLRDEARTKPKGLAYMLEQKLAKAARAALEARANQCVENFYAQIRECVDDIRLDKLKKADNGRQMLLNLPCLMDRSNGALGRVLDEIQKTEGVSVRFTGPWPPYNFVSPG
ncbi:MAG: GvpL/GvpF family gas vesicle protein [Phycisphaerae bacterium]|nr:GvpL/GvpF family gas vesicle protein [Phycisphaerae bacterium]